MGKGCAFEVQTLESEAEVCVRTAQNQGLTWDTIL